MSYARATIAFATAWRRSCGSRWFGRFLQAGSVGGFAAAERVSTKRVNLVMSCSWKRQLLLRWDRVNVVVTVNHILIEGLFVRMVICCPKLWM